MLKALNRPTPSAGEKAIRPGWGSYSWTPAVSVSLRATARTVDSIDGIDPMIVAPVQTADPAFQGGDRVDIGLGVNFSGQEGAWRGLRLGVEFGLPVYQDLNGPQLEGERMIKSELVSKLAESNPHLYQRDVERIVNTVFDEITGALSRGERIELRGFGAFSIKHRGARMGRNPRTGDAVHVEAKHVPYFKAGKDLRERLNR